MTSRVLSRRPAATAKASSAQVDSKDSPARLEKSFKPAPARDPQADNEDQEQAPPAAGPPTFGDIPVFPGGGEPVPGAMRERFEKKTGSSVEDARIHTGPESARMAGELGALACTVGQDVHFAAGQYQPGTAEGDHLLAHELTHTIQQQAVAPTPQMLMEDEDRDEAAEEEADAVADAVLDEEEDGEENTEKKTPITARPEPAVQMKKPKKKKAPPRAPKAKPIVFTLFKDAFTATVDSAGAVTVTAKKGSGAWVFVPDGANKVKASRTLDHQEYVHKGGATEPLVQRVSVTVPAGGPATPAQITAELGTPATLSIPLTGPKNAPRKNVTVNGVSVEQLDMSKGSMTMAPAEGDAVHLSKGGDAWVFTMIKTDPATPTTAKTPDVSGFFRAGYFTIYNDKGTPTPGSATPQLGDIDKKKAFDDLAALPASDPRRITTDEAELFKVVSLMESDKAGVQTYDTGVLSFGFAQWTVSSDLPRMLQRVDATTFERYLGRYGLKVGPPVRQLDSFVKKFEAVPKKRVGMTRNTAEGAIFLNGKELVTRKLLDRAASQGTAMAAFEKQAGAIKTAVAAAKPDLKSKVAAQKAAAQAVIADAKTKLKPIKTALSGLPGMKTLKDAEAQADVCETVASDAKDAANEVTANCISKEVLRGSEWAVRFEMLGQSKGGEDAQIAEARAVWSNVAAMTTDGATYATLVPNLRGQSALLSSQFNNPSAVKSGMPRAVKKFKEKKKAQATAALATATSKGRPAPTPSPADWTAFPWPGSDPRWTTLWTAAAIKEMEDIVVVEVTKGTTDAEKRRDTINAQFP